MPIEVSHSGLVSRTTRLFESFAKEPVRVEFVSGVLYGFGSELAVLRVFAKYNSNGSEHTPKVRVGFSQNLNSWYVSLECPLLQGLVNAP